MCILRYLFLLGKLVKICNKHSLSVVLVSYESNDTSFVIGVGKESCNKIYDEKPEWVKTTCNITTLEGKRVGQLIFISRIVCYGKHFVSSFENWNIDETEAVKIPTCTCAKTGMATCPIHKDMLLSVGTDTEGLPQPVKETADAAVSTMPPPSSPKRKRKPVKPKRPKSRPRSSTGRSRSADVRWVSAPANTTPIGQDLSHRPTPFEMHALRTNPYGQTEMMFQQSYMKKRGIRSKNSYGT